jgi:hypothetical protein
MPESVKKLESIGATSSSTPAELASQVQKAALPTEVPEF